MADQQYNVLFVCTHNCARSILAEAITNRWGRDRFHGFSAGSHPVGTVHPIALEMLRSMNFPTAHLRSKSWDEFAAPGAPLLDFVFMVCYDPMREVFPSWPGQPMIAHWSGPDPAAVVGSDTEKWIAFREAFRLLDHRIKVFTNLLFDSLDRITLQGRLDAIGRAQPPPSRLPLWPYSQR